MLQANLFYTLFYRTVTSCLANCVFRRDYSRGSCHGHARSCFQSALSQPSFTGANFVRLGAHVGAVVLLLADLRRLSLCHTWLCTALFATVYSSALFDAIPSCPHALSCTVLRTYVSYPSTQSPDALFSIILKPPTGVFYNHRPAFYNHRPTFYSPRPAFFLHTTSVFSCSVFTFGVFQNADSAFFYPRPVVLNTDQGFPEHRPVFSRGFRHRTQANYFDSVISMVEHSCPPCCGYGFPEKIWYFSISNSSQVFPSPRGMIKYF